MKEHLANTILQMIYNLKKSNDPLNNAKITEQYITDDEYDVKITVQLMKKKSQYEIGMEMFGYPPTNRIGDK